MSGNETVSLLKSELSESSADFLLFYISVEILLSPKGKATEQGAEVCFGCLTRCSSIDMNYS
jgi:hypothetical protein